MNEERPRAMDGQASSAADFKARSRFIVELPSGLKILSRKVLTTDFLGFGIMPELSPTDDIKTVAEKIKEYCARPEIRRAANIEVAKCAAISPRIEDGDPALVPADAIHWSDLGDGFEVYVVEVLKRSGWEAVAEKAGMFPSAENPPDDAATKVGGQRGDTIREAAI